MVANYFIKLSTTQNLKTERFLSTVPVKKTIGNYVHMMPFFKEVRKIENVQKIKNSKYGQIILRDCVNTEKGLEKVVFAVHPIA